MVHVNYNVNKALFRLNCAQLTFPVSSPGVFFSVRATIQINFSYRSMCHFEWVSKSQPTVEENESFVDQRSLVIMNRNKLKGGVSTYLPVSTELAGIIEELSALSL